MSRLAATPEPPYYAVIFTSQRTQTEQGYADAADRMDQLARAQPGYLGHESARGADGLGITVSYWASLESIQAWKAQAEHLYAQERGRRDWYEAYGVRVSKVERAYGFERRS